MTRLLPGWRMKFSLALILILIAAGEAWAQVPNFRQYDVEKKFPGIQVNVVYQDPTGFIWFGTNEGLIRFSGTEFQQYNLDSVEAPAVTALHHDEHGQFWTGFSDGTIARFSQGIFQRFEPAGKLPAAAITGIISGSDDILWFSTYGEGLFYFTNNRLYNMSETDRFPDNTVYDIAKDQQGRIWAGTDGGIGICSFRNNRKVIVKINTEDGLPDNIVTALAADEEGNIWIGMHDAGVAKYIVKEERFAEAQPGTWQYGPLKDLTVFDDEIWAGTDGYGIVIIDQHNKLHRQLNYPELLSTKVLDVTGDAEGNVWISTQYGGLFSASRRFSFLKMIGNKKLEDLHAVLAVNGNELLFSDSRGLYNFNFKSKELSQLLHTDENHFVISLYQDTFGFIWAGTFGDGLYRFDEAGNKSHFTEENGLINNNVLSINGEGKTIWFATLGGVSNAELTKGEEVNFRNFSGREGLGTNYIYQVTPGNRGDVWFATDGKGLARFSNGNFGSFNGMGGHDIKSVYSVAADDAGYIWFSTASEGLFRLGGDTVTHIGQEEGLSDLEITAVINAGTDLLVLHKDGIDLVDGKSLTVQNYGSEAGIGDINPDLNAFSRDNAGNVWIATQEGLLRYHAIESGRWKHPKTVLDEMLIYLQPREDFSQTLKHNQNHVSFEFTALWYQNPGQVSFQYRLEGFNEEWIQTQDRMVIYPNLAPGKYNFQVRATANNDFAGIPVIAYSFVIQAPFWTSWWFYALCALFTAAIIYGIVKLRERQMQLEQRLEREKISFQFETLRSQVNPHFLFNSFNTLISIIEEDKEVAVEYVENLSEFFRNILQYRDREVIPLREEIELINAYYYLQRKRYGTNLSLNVNIHTQDLEKYIPPLTLQLLVENAVKHNIISRSKPLEIEIFSTNNHHLIIRNTLQKKQKPERSTGIGLENIRKRYGMMTSEEILIAGEGNHFTVSIPLIEAKPL
ncbi:MAG: two-component regulator propeller domain-containing protein [Bacteroidia bacterium]